MTVGQFERLSTTEKVKYYLSIFSNEQLAELEKDWNEWYNNKEKYEGTVAEECVLLYMEEQRIRWADVYETIYC